jgi:hypothetical protein
MRILQTLMLVLATALLLAGPALADQDPKKGDEGGAGTEGGTDKAADPWDAPEVLKEPESDAAAQPEIVTPDAYPTAEIDRPFALPPLVLEPRAQVIFDFVNIRRMDNQFAIGLGAGFGIIEDLEAGIAIPMSVAPRVRLGDLHIYGLYDVGWAIGQAIQLAGRLNFIIPIPHDTRYSYWDGVDFALLLDTPFKFKIIDMLAVIADLGIGWGLFDPGDDAFLLFFDAGVLFQAMEALAIEFTCGAHVFAGKDYTAVPMHLKGQYTLIGDLDLFVDFSFRDLNKLNADWFQVLFGAAFRIGF